MLDLCIGADQDDLFQLGKLQHGVFLPSLIRVAEAGHADAVTGIASIPGTASLEALLHLLENPSTTHETFVRSAASSSAQALGARVELWDAWCEVITDQDFMVEALGQLASGTLDLASNGSSWGNSNFTREPRFAIRDAWRVFLAKNRDRLARGERIPLNDPSVTLSLTGANFDPQAPAIQFQLTDGKTWPPTPAHPQP